MRVKQIRDIDGFFKALEHCQGRVELITDEKDVLNQSNAGKKRGIIQSVNDNGEKR